MSLLTRVAQGTTAVGLALGIKAATPSSVEANVFKALPHDQYVPAQTRSNSGRGRSIPNWVLAIPVGLALSPWLFGGSSKGSKASPSVRQEAFSPDHVRARRTQKTQKGTYATSVHGFTMPTEAYERIVAYSQGSVTCSPIQKEDAQKVLTFMRKNSGLVHPQTLAGNRVSKKEAVILFQQLVFAVIPGDIKNNLFTVLDDQPEPTEKTVAKAPEPEVAVQKDEGPATSRRGTTSRRSMKKKGTNWLGRQFQKRRGD